MTIKNSRFRPNNVEVMIGDTVSVTIINQQGLHKIRDTRTGRTILLQPGDIHEIVFYAEEEGNFKLTCNPYCDEPMEAWIKVRKAYKKIC